MRALALSFLFASLSFASPLNRGIQALGQRDYESAAVWFVKASKAEKSARRRCEANFGRLLSLGADLAQQALAVSAFSDSSLLERFGGGTISSFYQIKALLVLGLPLITGILDGLAPTLKVRYLEPMQEAATLVSKQKCSFYIQRGVPLIVSKDPLRVVYIGEKFPYQLATLLQGATGVGLALVDSLLSLELNAPLSSLAREVPVDELFGPGPKDYIAIFRRSAIIFDRNPNYLQFKTLAPYPLKEAGLQLASGAQALAQGLRAEPMLPFHKGFALRILDRDGNQSYSRGDQIVLQVVRTEGPFPYKEWKGGPQEVSLTSKPPLSFFVTPKTLSTLGALLQKVAAHIQEGDPPLLPLSSMNALLPLSVKFFPETMALDLKSYFFAEHPMPPAHFFPYIASERHGKTSFPVFLVEEERRGKAPDLFYVTEPGPHFGKFDQFSFLDLRGLSVTPLPDDCLGPKKGESLLYSLFPDPSWGGLLRIDLTPLVANNACHDRDLLASFGGFESRRDFPLPSLYAYNKAMNQWVKSIAPLLRLFGSFNNRKP